MNSLINLNVTKTIRRYVPANKMQKKIHCTHVKFSCLKKIIPESDQVSRYDYQFRESIWMDGGTR